MNAAKQCKCIRLLANLICQIFTLQKLHVCMSTTVW